MKKKKTIILSIGERQIGSISVSEEDSRDNIQISRRRGEINIPRKALIPPEFQEYYYSVEAAITAKLGIDSSQSVGETPFQYGDMGGLDSALNSLEELNKGNIDDATIAKAYLKNQGIEEIREDPEAFARVISAISSIRGATPVK